jgi:hypothetical protein
MPETQSLTTLRQGIESIAWSYTDPPDPEWAEMAAMIAAHYTPPDVGRHSIIGNQEIISRLLTHLAHGNYLNAAAHLAGTTEVTVNALKKRGEDGETPFDGFLIALKIAESKSEDGAVRQVLKAGQDPRFWTAPMTFLERKYPDRWGRRQDDSSVPKVVVQIGVKDSDVSITVNNE